MMQAALVEEQFIGHAVSFAEEADSYTHIRSKTAYEKALEMVSRLMDIAPDNSKSTLNSIISVIAESISEYEDSLESVQEFEKAVSDMPADISALRVLMNQYELNGTDLPEIGDKTLVSKILNGKRNLTREHIEKLSARFKVSPALFFD